MSKVQSPKSKVQSPKSKVQSPKSKVQSPKSTVPVTLNVDNFKKYIISLIKLFSGGYVTEETGLYSNLVTYTIKLTKDYNNSKGNTEEILRNFRTINRILISIVSFNTELHKNKNDGFVSLKNCTRLNAETYDLLLKFTIDLGNVLQEMINNLKITIFNENTNKEDNIQNFIISQIIENNKNLTTELGALKNNKLFTNIDIVKYISNIPTDNISNFINYRINECHVFTMFINEGKFTNYYDTTWKDYLPSETTTKYMKYKTKYLRIKNKLMLILDK